MRNVILFGKLMPKGQLKYYYLMFIYFYKFTHQFNTVGILQYGFTKFPLGFTKLLS